MIKVLNAEEVIKQMRVCRGEVKYHAMYSSWFDGIVTDPSLMLVPVDDHMVHRGDAVFEAIKTVEKRVYLLKAHLDRLERSAASLSLPLPVSRKKLEEIIGELLCQVDRDHVMIRLFVSRGPGGFTTNPYESIGSQLYILITDLKPVAPHFYEIGVKIRKSQIPAKDGFFAGIKSCNYLLNVLMKKEAVDLGVDFVIGVTVDGWITESSTENIAFISQKNELCFPSFDLCLRGTTLTHVIELAESLKHQGRIVEISSVRCPFAELLRAKEVFMVGTTLDILPVTEVEGHKIGEGVAGPVARELLEKLRKVQRHGPCFDDCRF